MKRVQLSGAQKRKRAKENEQNNLSVVAKTGKLTDFFLQTAEKDDPDQNQCQSSETASESNLSPSSETGSVGARPDFHDDVAHDEVPQPGPSSTTRCVNAFELSKEFRELTKDEMNKAKDPGLWDEFYGDDVTYWVACGRSECQHHNGPFDKSCRNFISGKPKRYRSQKIFFGIKANGEHYKREWLLYSPSKGSVYCFVCKLFAPKGSTHFARNEGFSDWRNTAVIDNHEKSTTHRDAMLTYLTRKQGLGLTQPLEKQIKEEYNYWENVLRHVVAVICTLAERGLAFRGKVEKFGSLNNGNYLGLLELMSV